MSANDGQDNFEQLRRVLAIKRHEQPPPRYFIDLPHEVFSRLVSSEEPQRLPWWQRLSFGLDFRPACVCGLGVMVCTLMSLGILASSGGVYTFPGDTANLLPRVSLAALEAPRPVQSSVQPVLASEAGFPQFRPAVDLAE